LYRRPLAQACRHVLGFSAATIGAERGAVGADNGHASADFAVAAGLRGSGHTMAEGDRFIRRPVVVDVRFDGAAEAIADMRWSCALAGFDDVGGAIAVPRRALLSEAAIAGRRGRARRFVAEMKRLLKIDFGELNRDERLI